MKTEKDRDYPSILIGIDEHKLVPVVGTSNESTSGVHNCFLNSQVFSPFFKSTTPLGFRRKRSTLALLNTPTSHPLPPHKTKTQNRIQNPSFPPQVIPNCGQKYKKHQNAIPFLLNRAR